MKRSTLIARLRALRPQLAEKGVAHLSVFGSRARGDQHPESDLDILLDLDPTARLSLLELIGVEHLVADNVGLSAHAMLRRGLDRSFERSIERDLVKVF